MEWRTNATARMVKIKSKRKRSSDATNFYFEIPGNFMSDVKCEVCGVTAKEVHVRVISGDERDVPCYYSWSCENNSWPGTNDSHGLKRWSKYSRQCGCSKIGISDAPAYRFNSCACASCLVCAPHSNHGCECQPYSEKEIQKL